MSHPPIQIVDEDDKPVGVATMDEAQLQGLYHRIVRVIIEDENGRILLQKRSPKMFLAPNLWDNSASGHVDGGEDYLTATKRELLEELGIETELVEIGKYITNNKHDDRIFNRFNKVYKGKIQSTDELNVDDDEISGTRWIDTESLKSELAANPQDFTDGIHDIVKRFYSK